jgi:Acyl-coenzyme A synthetases/AMP-(fatty) acid ligases
VRLNDNNTDKLAIFFHTEKVDDALFNLLKEIRTQVVKQVGINPDYLIPVAKEIIPKTAIGKIQRSQLSQRFIVVNFKKLLNKLISCLVILTLFPIGFIGNLATKKPDN